jgi:hypothetical protein
MNIEFNNWELVFLRELIFDRIDKVGGFEGLNESEQTALMKILDAEADTFAIEGFVETFGE